MGIVINFKGVVLETRCNDFHYGSQKVYISEEKIRACTSMT
jgi:hypothetical protein